MGIYQIGNRWYVDLYLDGRRRRKAIGSRKEAENALTTIKADVLRGEFKFREENKVHFEVFTENYIDLVTVNEILGHAAIQMTMRYAHPTPENKRQAVEILSRLFENLNGEATAEQRGQTQASS